SLSNFDHKIIFVGATAESLHDSQKTPVSGGSSMQGVEIHAQIANMLLLKYHLSALPVLITLLWILFAALVAMLSLTLIPRFEIAIFTNIGIGVLYLILGVVWFEKGTEVNLIHITLAWLLPTIALSLYRFFSSEK